MNDIEGEKDALNTLTQLYDSEAPFDKKMREYMMRTIDLFAVDGPCLQVGCSHGDQTSLLAKRFSDLTVVEATSEFIDWTRRRTVAAGHNVKYVESMIETFEPVQDFSTIVFSHVLEHVLDPVEVLAKLGAMLSANGRLVVIVPNGSAASRHIAVKMGVLSHLEAMSKADIEGGHRRVYFLDTLARDCQQAGLKIFDTGGIFFKPLANFQFDSLMGSELISDEFMEGCFALGKEFPTLSASIYAVATR